MADYSSSENDETGFSSDSEHQEFSEHEEHQDFSEFDMHPPQAEDDEHSGGGDDHLSNSEHIKKLESLSREVKDAYNQELKDTCARLGTDDVEATASRNKSKPIRELVKQEEEKKDQELQEIPNNTDETTAEITPSEANTKQQSSPFLVSSSPTIKLDAIQSWQELLDALVEHQVFLEYIPSLTEAFREVNEKSPPVPDSEEEDLDNLWFRHQLNLAHLLAHTVKNHQRDNCTECRFVTLLEVALSYQNVVPGEDGGDGDGDESQEPVHHWKPSESVQRFWVRLMQPIEPDITSTDFRRRAYGVLVSLSWVPSSKGLLEACSIADSRPSTLPQATPFGAQEVLYKIPRRPLPRHDSVYQVLDRLKDETNVSVVITGSKSSNVTPVGIGKTTVAALVASHNLILRSFKVLWLKMDYKSRRIGVATDGDNGEARRAKLSYVEYVEYLDELCDQLGFKDVDDSDSDDSSNSERSMSKRPTWPEQYSLKRLEEPAIRQMREASLMREAQSMMADVLEDTGRNVLVILDDASEEDELKWFHFVEQQSILATSLSPITTADFTIELDPWGEDEAVALFLLEVDYIQSNLMASAAEVKEIVARCHYHPLIIRMVARWFKLKKVSAGLVLALEDAKSECIEENMTIEGDVVVKDAVTGTSVVIPRVLKYVMDQALSPITKRMQQPSILFKLCLASMAAVFAEFQPVPLTAVMLLWEQLFAMEPDAMDECGGDMSSIELRRRVWFIAEGLTHMGLLSFTEDESGDCYVSIHHDLYVTYGIRLVTDMDLGEDPKETCAQWHKAFVAAYLTRKFSEAAPTPESCQHYALQQLPTHMLYCRLYDKVMALLSNGRLYQERIDAFGWQNATILHVHDCVQVLKNIRRDPDMPREQKNDIVSGHFQAIATLLVDQIDMSNEKDVISLCKDLYSIGFALAENKKFVEARELYETAQRHVPKSNSFVSSILYGLGTVNLLLNEPAKAMKSLMASMACMKILGEVGGYGERKNRFYQEVLRMQGEAMVAQCNYKAALSHFDEAMENLSHDESFEGQTEHGTLLFCKGRLHQVMGQLEKASEELNKSIKWKDSHGECSRSLARTHSVLGDVYFAMGKLPDVRRHMDLALKKTQEVDARWPQIRCDKDDDESEYDLETKLLFAKLRSLRPDLPQNWTSFEEVREQILKNPILLMDQSAYDLRCIARAYLAADEHDTGASILEEALKLMTDRTESLERALCLIDLGNSFLDRGSALEDDEPNAQSLFRLALTFFELAYKIQEHKLGEWQQVLETLDAIGNLHVNLRQHEDAISVYNNTLSLAMKLRSDFEKVAGILYFLGECYEAIGDYDTAEKQYKQCLMGLAVNRNPTDLDLARPMQRLGAISLVKGDYHNAQSIYDNILEIRRANFDSSNILLAETLDVLGFLAVKCRTYDIACNYLLEALNIRKNHDNLRATGDTLFQIGNAYRMLGDNQNALTYLVHSSTTLEGSVDEHDPLLGSVALAMGSISFTLGKDDEALEYFKQSVNIRKTALGKDHRKTANAYRSLGMVSFLLNQNEDASSLLQDYTRIIERQEQEYRNDIEYVVALIMLSDIQTACGKHKQAKKALSAAKEVCKSAATTASAQEVYEPTGWLPELESMVDDRRSIPTPSLLMRMHDRQQEDAVVLEHNPSETSVFRKLVFTDD